MMPAFFLPFMLSLMETFMTQNLAKARRMADAAFTQSQKQFFSKGDALEEEEFITQAREVKTLRLRDARRAKELKDRTTAISRLISMRDKYV
jgi:hypothetical protein